MFTEGDDDELTEEEIAIETPTDVVSRASKRASIKADVLHDLGDDEDEDDELEDDDEDGGDEEDDDDDGDDDDEEEEESERTQTVRSNSSPRRVRMQQHRSSSGRLLSVTTPQSPLKSVLKTGSMAK